MAWCKSETETKLKDLKNEKEKLLEERSSYKQLRPDQMQPYERDMLQEVEYQLIIVNREMSAMENALKKNTFSKEPT